MKTNGSPLSILGANLARAGVLRLAQHNDDCCVTRKEPIGTFNVRRLARGAFLTLDTRATWGHWETASMYADAAILAIGVGC